ncbi:hypothetical protein [Pacificibacter marinus]|uniref:hypothetical protein n=1 Tax=Pacificibacter marinus TaxID=658057 RepID=UPI001113EDAD|nr:hypothetical protein [Pacificibacter marinus]
MIFPLWVLCLVDGPKAIELKSVCPVLEKLILTVVARYGAAYVAPRLMIELFGFQFLKKAPVKANKQNSDTSKQVAETISGPLGEAINREVDAIRTAKHYN